MERNKLARQIIDTCLEMTRLAHIRHWRWAVLYGSFHS